MTTYFPLRGEGADRPKAPAVDGWQSPAYQSLDKPGSGIWLAIRTDNLVVVDCDNVEAMRAWVKRVGKENATTFMRKTPHGYHFYYRWTPGSPDTQRLGIFPKTDIKAGFGAYVVWEAPGYFTIDGIEWARMRDFNPQWVPSRTVASDETEEWSEMPDGRGNMTMMSIAGTLRKQGMDADTMERVLQSINEITMERDPMPEDMIQTLARSASRYEPDPDIELQYGMDEPVDPETGEVRNQEDQVFMDVRWMRPRPHPGWWWQPYLPKASLVIVEGQESVGKTMFAAYAAAQIAMGAGFDGEPQHPQNVMWFATEDDPYAEILPRFLAAGYDQDDDAAGRILIFNPLFWEREPRFPKSSDQLQKLIVEHNVGLVVFDPARDYLAPEDGAEASNNNEKAIRPGLRALNRIAQQTGATILGGHHQNKRTDRDAGTRERSTGSVAFRQVPRQVNTMEKVGLLRAMSVEKANGFDHEFTVSSYEIDAVGPDGETTGLFVPGGLMPEYRSLDEWRRTQEKLDTEADSSINFGVDWNDAAEYYRTLEEGDLAPSTTAIMHDLDVDEEQAKAMRFELRDHGFIKGERWHPVPKQVQPPSLPQ